MTTQHDTITLTRTLAHPPARVFAAFADPAARALWAPPSPVLNMRYEKADFRIGGRDYVVCGPGPAEGVSVETLYHAIVETQLIVFTETFSGETPEASTLVTVAFSAQGAGTTLDVTLQVAAYGAPDAIAEVHGGWTAALDNLGGYLSAPV